MFLENKQSSFFFSQTVCVNVTDVQTNTGLSNVTFFFSQNGRPAFKTIDEDGSICFKTLTTGKVIYPKYVLTFWHTQQIVTAVKY